jgi:deoxycytidine triphosphate deaminase
MATIQAPSILDSRWHHQGLAAGDTVIVHSTKALADGTRIKPGMKAGQMIFFEHEEVPADRSYAARGQYNNDRSVTAGKGLK